MALKYIRLRQQGFVLFETDQVHKEVATMLGGDVISAGNVSAVDWCENGRAECYGESSSLNRHARETDSQDLQILLLAGVPYIRAEHRGFFLFEPTHNAEALKAAIGSKVLSSGRVTSTRIGYEYKIACSQASDTEALHRRLQR